MDNSGGGGPAWFTMSRMGAVDRILAAQQGLITRKQALTTGASSATISRLLESKEWRTVFPGVYRHVAVPVTDGLMLLAALLWLGPTAVVSGSWAAWWHELRSEPDGPVSVTVPRSASARHHRHVDIRRRDLDPSDITVLREVRVTSRALTALENAGLVEGSNVLDRALQRRLPLPELERTMGRLARAHGAPVARAALAERTDGTVSAPERALARALRAAGLTNFRAGVTVYARDRRCWLDFADDELKIAIEVDGVAPHTDPAVFHRDRTRQNALILDRWVMLRFTPWQIRNELARVMAEICAAVDDRRRSVEENARR